jgi:hypothetical protein
MFRMRSQARGTGKRITLRERLAARTGLGVGRGMGFVPWLPGQDEVPPW